MHRYDAMSVHSQAVVHVVCSNQSACHYFTLTTAPKYCDDYVCLSVCSCSHISETRRPNFTKFFVHVAYDHCPIRLRCRLWYIMYLQCRGWRHVIVRWIQSYSALPAGESETAVATVWIPTKVRSITKMSN